MNYSRQIFLSVISLFWFSSLAIANDDSSGADLSLPPGLEVVDQSRIAEAVELSAEVSGLQSELSADRDVVWVKVFVDDQTGVASSLQPVYWTLKDFWLEDVAEMVSVLAIENAEKQVQSSRESWYYQPVAFNLYVDSASVGQSDSKSNKKRKSKQVLLQVHVAPSPIHFEEMDYPDNLDGNAIPGTVTLLAQIGTDGTVQESKIYRSSGNSFLDKAAITISPKHRFTPMFTDGNPRSGWVFYRTRFHDIGDSLRLTTVFDSAPRNPSFHGFLPRADEFVPVEIMPEMISEVTPKYTGSRKSGRVWIKVLVDKNGKVKEAAIAKSSGHKQLDDAALKVAPKNRFKPGIQNGKPIAVWVTYKIDFIKE